MLLHWKAVLLDMLASESRMVVHVTVGAVDSRILVNLVIEIEAIDNPLECRLPAALEIADLPSQLDME